MLEIKTITQLLLDGQVISATENSVKDRPKEINIKIEWGDNLPKAASITYVPTNKSLKPVTLDLSEIDQSDFLQDYAFHKKYYERARAS